MRQTDVVKPTVRSCLGVTDFENVGRHLTCCCHSSSTDTCVAGCRG